MVADVEAGAGSESAEALIERLRVYQPGEADTILAALRIRDTLKNMLWHGYSGKLGYSSAAAMNDYIVQNMVASAASGAKSPQDAVAAAEKRLNRFYKL